MKTSLHIVTLLATACTTVPGIGSRNGDDRKEIIGLEEMSLEYIQTLWGTPDANVPAGDGRTVRFKNIRADDEDPISGKIEVKFCDVRLDVNRQQLVKTWQYESCRPKSTN